MKLVICGHYDIWFYLSKTEDVLTFFLLLCHDGVAEGQQSEEGVDLWVLQLHRLHQGVVVEHEAGVRQRVEGEVHPLCMLREREVHLYN